MGQVLKALECSVLLSPRQLVVYCCGGGNRRDQGPVPAQQSGVRV